MARAGEALASMMSRTNTSSIPDDLTGLRESVGTKSRAIAQGQHDWWRDLIQEPGMSVEHAIQELKQRLRDDPRGENLLKHRGVFGETILHQCILFSGTFPKFDVRVTVRPGTP